MTPTFLLLLPLASFAPQGGPPPLVLPPPPVPAANPLTPAKVELGRALFWDEQLSSTNTTACGTCHIPSGAGSDPRAGATHPGPDAIPGTPDDVLGSTGVPLGRSEDAYGWSELFGMAPQVTGRRSMAAINAAYPPELFWDGRAGQVFEDPDTGQVLIPEGGALENQVLGPPVSTAEMGHEDRDWTDVANKIADARPLALSPEVPAALDAFIAGREYPALFSDAFGTSDVTPARIAMAIASYERTLFSDQAPILTGPPNVVLTPQELAGFQLFNQLACNNCHQGGDFTDDQFRYIGVRPAGEDVGRMAVTGNPGDRGRMKTPSLLNVELRAPYMHNGRFETLRDVVLFYSRGGDFNAPNKDPRIQPLGLNGNQIDALVAFLERPLTDPRVAAETGRFERPLLSSEVDRAPRLASADGLAGSGGFVPQFVALEPPAVGNDSFTVGVHSSLPGARALLVVGLEPPSIEPLLRWSPGQRLIPTLLEGPSPEAGAGFGSVSLSLPGDPSFVGRTLFGRWYVRDDGTAAPAAFSTGGGRGPAAGQAAFSASDAFELTLF